MKLPTDAHQSDFSRHFSSFCLHVPERVWHKQVEEIEKEIKGNKFLKGVLYRQNRLARSLSWISQYKNKNNSLNFKLDEFDGLYEACVFVSQFALLMEGVAHKKMVQLSKRIQGALRNPSDARAMIFELQVATHFLKNGFSVDFVESGESACCDLIARSEAAGEIEIECKSISSEKGFVVKQYDAMNILGLIHKMLVPLLKGVEGVLLIKIRFKDAVPKKHNEKLEVARAVKSAVYTGRSMRDNFQIDVSNHGLKKNVLGWSVGDFSDFLKKNNLRSENSIFIKIDAGVVFICIESEHHDSSLDEIFSTAADASKRQLTGKYPGIICMKFEGISGHELRAIGEEIGEPTALRKMASKFLNSTSAVNTTAIAFLADDDLESSGGAVTRNMSAYYFLNEKNRFHQEAKGINIFRPVS